MDDATASPAGHLPWLAQSLDARSSLFDPRHEAAFRLFNGFYEGCPDLVADLYGRTLVLHNYADPPESGRRLAQAAADILRARLPWVQAVVLKDRRAADPVDRCGALIHGTTPDRKVREGGAWYAIDLLLNRDASFYPDTRHLRAWAASRLAGKTVLNTFAYTGSLGVAARAGGAARVVHLDQSRAFLNVAKTSYTLNGFPIHKPDFIAGDFWAATSRMRRAGDTFDCVLLDPPFFAASSQGTIDLAGHGHRLINKVRPLIAGGGWLVVVNNALFLPGAGWLASLQQVCADGYLSIEDLIPVPEDVTGYPATRAGAPPVDPAPFNHPTKIAVLRVRRKP